MAIFHEKLGYQLDHMEGSAELTTRLVGSLNVTHSPLFLEDALIQLEITRDPDVGNKYLAMRKSRQGIEWQCRSCYFYSCLSTVATNLLADPFNARDSLRIILSVGDFNHL
jgi:hypothetical protein